MGHVEIGYFLGANDFDKRWQLVDSVPTFLVVNLTPQLTASLPPENQWLEGAKGWKGGNSNSKSHFSELLNLTKGIHKNANNIYPA